MIEPDEPGIGAEFAGLHHLHAARLFQDRHEVDVRILPEIDLAVDQRRHRGLRIRDPDEFDAVDAGEFRAGEERGALVAGPRHIVGILQVDGLAAGHPLVLGEFEWPRTDRLLDLLLRIGQRILLAHDDRDRRAALAERLEHHAVGLVEHHAERLVVDGLLALDEREQPLADIVARRPALERGDHVLGGDRRSVMKFQPVAQRERVGELVRADLVFADHLRLRIELVVVAEQRVVDQHPVDARDGLRGPERIERAHVGMQHGAQNLLLRVDDCCGCDGGGKRDHGSEACSHQPNLLPQAH